MNGPNPESYPGSSSRCLRGWTRTRPGSTSLLRREEKMPEQIHLQGLGSKSAPGPPFPCICLTSSPAVYPDSSIPIYSVHVLANPQNPKPLAPKAPKHDLKTPSWSPGRKAELRGGKGSQSQSRFGQHRVRSSVLRLILWVKGSFTGS